MVGFGGPSPKDPKQREFRPGAGVVVAVLIGLIVLILLFK
jgi:hypothetical protein